MNFAKTKCCTMTQKNKGLPFQNNSLFALLVTPCPTPHGLIPHGWRYLPKLK